MPFLVHGALDALLIVSMGGVRITSEGCILGRAIKVEVGLVDRHGPSWGCAENTHWMSLRSGAGMERERSKDGQEDEALFSPKRLRKPVQRYELRGGWESLAASA